MTLLYQGLLSSHSWGEASDILFLSTLSDPLAQVLQSNIANKTVTARYWITDKEVSRDEAQEAFLQKLFGKADCEFGSQYSEITGYLWTDENCKIGGHDILQELCNNIGKWLILEIEVHEP